MVPRPYIPLWYHTIVMIQCQYHANTFPPLSPSSSQKPKPPGLLPTNNATRPFIVQQQCTNQCYSTSFLDIRQSLSETTQKQPSHTWHINHSINVIINIINGLILSPFRLCLPNWGHLIWVETSLILSAMRFMGNDWLGAQCISWYCCNTNTNTQIHKYNDVFHGKFLVGARRHLC